MLQVFQTLGACLYADYEIIHIPNRVASRLVVEFRSRLNTMNDSWQLNSGLGMENLWKAFRPATAKDWTSLNLSLHLKKQAVQFEALKWRSGASTQELIHVHESMVKMHIDSTSARVTGSALSEVRLPCILPDSSLTRCSLSKRPWTILKINRVHLSRALPHTFDLSSACCISMKTTARILSLMIWMLD